MKIILLQFVSLKCPCRVIFHQSFYRVNVLTLFFKLILTAKFPFGCLHRCVIFLSRIGANKSMFTSIINKNTLTAILSVRRWAVMFCLWKRETVSGQERIQWHSSKVTLFLVVYARHVPLLAVITSYVCSNYTIHKIISHYRKSSRVFGIRMMLEYFCTTRLI